MSFNLLFSVFLNMALVDNLGVLMVVVSAVNNCTHLLFNSIIPVISHRNNFPLCASTRYFLGDSLHVDRITCQHSASACSEKCSNLFVRVFTDVVVVVLQCIVVAVNFLATLRLTSPEEQIYCYLSLVHFQPKILDSL